MSNFFDKARQKVKKKVGQTVNRLRPSSRETRSSSPVSLQHEPTNIAVEPQSLIAPTSAAIPSVPSSQLANPIPTNGPPPPPEHTSLSAPAYAMPPSPPTILATTGSAVRGLFIAVRDGSDLFLPLKAALVGIVALWDIFDRTAEAKAEFTKLESRLLAFKVIADAHQDQPHEVDQTLHSRLASISQAVQSLWEAVEQRQARGSAARVAQSSIDLSDIKALVNAISSLLEVFQFESSIAVEKRLGLIDERLEMDRNERLVKERTKKQEKVMKKIQSTLGENFVSEAADYEQPSYAGCMPGTRVGVLSKFVAWVKNDPMSIFWLAGMAGTGKTSIAISLCRMLRNDATVLLAGGYFCSRSAGTLARTDVRRILPTLATLLASQSKEFSGLLAAELERDHNLGHKPVVEQIGPLLQRPLAALASSSRCIVFIIDGLDECSNERELAELLRLLADFECDANVKFILTSRPELHIRGTPISNSSHNTILQLHTISADEVTSDIRLFIKQTLNDASPEGTWYTYRDIDALVMVCGGLFIFASTVLLYVLDPDDDDDRQDRLHRATSAVATCTAATAAVDRIYELVLTEASRSDTMDSVELERMKNILACILAARTSLSVEAMAELIELKPGRLRASLRRLHSLVHLPVDDKQPGLRTLHTSFGDYLNDRAPLHLKIKATPGHDILALGCLKRMSWDDLCFNVSRSSSSFLPNPKKSTLGWLSTSLVYACLHWAHHIDNASSRQTFDAGINGKFRPKFLFWLEVLSILGKIGFASGLQRIADSAVTMTVVSQFLRDADAFVASSHEAMGRSAPHIYTSALPFAAKDSLVYRDFALLYTGVISVVTYGTDRHAGNLYATLTGHEDIVRSVAYSPDGRLLISGSDDGTVRIWDTRTGEETATRLQNNDSKVLSVAYSPNGRLVASGRDGGVVNVWSVATGLAALPPMRGHSRWVRSVAFSPDGTLIASASNDNTFRLWSAETGDVMYSLSGHTGGVNEIAFAPDGELLASASDDGSIRLWDPHTGEAARAPLIGLEDKVEYVTFSLDGKYLAAGSANTNEIRIWDMETKKQAPVVIRNQVSVSFLVFSPDGRRLLSGGLRNIRSWDTQTGRELPGSSLSGHSDWVRSVSFSPDGRFLASGSADCTVRIWNAVSDTSSAIQPLQAHSSYVTSIAVSADGAYIVSGSADSSVRVWNARTGEAGLLPLIGHSAEVLAVAIAWDGRLIASASKDRTVRLWDTQTGESVGEPLLGHEEEVNAVAFSPDGRWLVSGSDDNDVRVWDVGTRMEASFDPLQCAGIVLAVAFSPDGRLIAAGDLRGYVHLWRAGTDRPARAPLQASSEGIYTVAFSPDSSRILCGGTDKCVRICDIDSGDQAFVLEGHLERVLSATYSSDGLYIASGSEDKTVRLWNAATGAAISIFFGHGHYVMSVVFAPDRRFVMSSGGDSTIHAWDVEAALLLPLHSERDPLARLGCSALNGDGWLEGSSGELLLWLPSEYRGCIQLPPCSMVIGTHRIVLASSGSLYWGDQWTQGWRDLAHSIKPSP